MEPKIVNNNTININLFLNEKYGDAINFTEFIKLRSKFYRTSKYLQMGM